MIDPYKILTNELFEEVCSSYIGNLLPLAESIQGDIGEEFEFANKIPHYKKSNFETVKQFVGNHETQTIWGREEIEKRTIELAEVFYKNIFNLGQIG